MSTKKTTSSRQVTIGTEEYINSRTGEVREFEVISVRDRDFNFEKIWLFKLLELLELTGGAKVKVIAWMLENRSADNLVIATQEKISEECNSSQKTVSRVISEMVEVGLLLKLQNGVYQLDPSLIWKGSHHSRMDVLLSFEATQQRSTSNYPETSGTPSEKPSEDSSLETLEEDSEKPSETPSEDSSLETPSVDSSRKRTGRV